MFHLQGRGGDTKGGSNQFNEKGKTPFRQNFKLLNDFLKASAWLVDGSFVCLFVLRKVIARKLNMNLQVFVHRESSVKGKGLGY